MKNIYEWRENQQREQKEQRERKKKQDIQKLASKIVHKDTICERCNNKLHFVKSHDRFTDLVTLVPVFYADSYDCLYCNFSSNFSYKSLVVSTDLLKGIMRGENKNFTNFTNFNTPKVKIPLLWHPKIKSSYTHLFFATAISYCANKLKSIITNIFKKHQ